MISPTSKPTPLAHVQVVSSLSNIYISLRIQTVRFLKAFSRGHRYISMSPSAETDDQRYAKFHNRDYLRSQTQDSLLCTIRPLSEDILSFLDVRLRAAALYDAHVDRLIADVRKPTGRVGVLEDKSQSEVSACDQVLRLQMLFTYIAYGGYDFRMFCPPEVYPLHTPPHAPADAEVVRDSKQVDVRRPKSDPYRSIFLVRNLRFPLNVIRDALL